MENHDIEVRDIIRDTLDRLELPLLMTRDVAEHIIVDLHWRGFDFVLTIERPGDTKASA